MQAEEDSYPKTYKGLMPKKYPEYLRKNNIHAILIEIFDFAEDAITEGVYHLEPDPENELYTKVMAVVLKEGIETEDARRIIDANWRWCTRIIVIAPKDKTYTVIAENDEFVLNGAWTAKLNRLRNIMQDFNSAHKRIGSWQLI